MKTLYLECNMGAAGDMLMGALLELLSPKEKEEFLEELNHAGIQMCIRDRCKTDSGGNRRGY